jgi:hypothetical protein
MAGTPGRAVADQRQYSREWRAAADYAALSRKAAEARSDQRGDRRWTQIGKDEHE